MGCSSWTLGDDRRPLVPNLGEVDSGMLVQVASRLVVGDIPEEVVDGIRFGRSTALAKPDGGVRRIVIGDIVRRLVARTMAKQGHDEGREG